MKHTGSGRCDGVQNFFRNRRVCVSIHDIPVNANEFVNFIPCDTIEYRKFFNNKAVKKTLSIPSWRNDMAERAGINFSATLQNALKQQLNIP